MAVAGSEPTSLSAVPAHHAAHQADAPALRFEGRTFTCGELAAWSDALAGRLWHEWGVRSGDRVAWLGLNHVAQLALLFALARLGAILLPLNFRLAPAEWSAQLAECGPLRLVHDDSFEAAARELAAKYGLALHPVGELEGSGPPAPDHSGDDAAVLLVYTSGTTSRPKAAVHTQGNLLANMRIASLVQRMTPDDRVLTVLPLFHVGGLCIQTLPALYAGAQVQLHARFAPDAVFDSLETFAPTLTLQVPATMKALIEHPRWAGAPLSGLRAVWAGSSLLPAPLVHAFHARGVPVCNVYGATETGPFSIALQPEHAMNHVGSCGWPAPGVEARLAVASGGDLWLRGPNIVRRYWPDQAACDAEGWFNTGDLARQAADGSYTIVGRSKELIISGGENIHPAEIEAPLSEHPDVAECAAFGVPDPDWGEAAAIAVVLREGSSVTDEELRAYLAQRIAKFKLPRHWVRVEQLPKTALGKVQRTQLAALLRAKR
ncbi:class I adenylate-forming enzyme family protein [Ramlibacter humi]|uniref:Long-chain fatty acid--CoA ligase n=1 Tax=Ramlibacter humi TaxID=2530451 RepID=A0A4Z0BR54_9BURK|nr:AMP-binding protein [Ramlibacter humi]TFZ01806.1 long-chain fatty acid--CoA ligase [Ramlibacter humi]